MNTPLDTFRSDQALAAARDIAATGTPAVAFTKVDSGPCAWCDCDVTAEQHNPEFCAGCPCGAAMVMHVFNANAPVRRDIPLCVGHQADALRFVAAIVQAGGLL
uniref:Uncharacterized protein n=1 Tax=Streptomyces sp. NBC_00093 TaxID=2975649 RepID=A0AAU2A1T2_9ACTN